MKFNRAAYQPGVRKVGLCLCQLRGLRQGLRITLQVDQFAHIAHTHLARRRGGKVVAQQCIQIVGTTVEQIDGQRGNVVRQRCQCRAFARRRQCSSAIARYQTQIANCGPSGRPAVAVAQFGS